MQKMQGVIVAMTTPFTPDDKVDVEALKKQVNYLLDRNVNCLYPCGTTGEMYLCSVEERELIAETVVREVNGKISVFIHTGAMNTKDTIRLAKHAYEIGADGIGVVTPAFFGLSERALINYYQEVCSSVPVDFPVYVYVIPQLAAKDVLPETLKKICDVCPNVVGVKYSYADMDRMIQYTQVKPEFSVLFGPDHMFLPALIAGAEGTVSGCAQAIPEPYVDVYNKYIQGDIEGAVEAQKIATKVSWALKKGSDMSVFKNVLERRGIGGNHMRRPLLDLAETERESLFADLEECFKDTEYRL